MTVSQQQILRKAGPKYNRNAPIRYEAASWYFFNAYKDKAVLEILQCSLKLRRIVGALGLYVFTEIGPGTGYLLHRLLSFEGRRIF